MRWLSVAMGLVAIGWVTASGASGATCQSWGAQPANVGSAVNSLNGVDATSACNAWAVGEYYNGTAYQTLIERWSGKAWKVQASPDPGGTSGSLFDVTAISPTNAWAVGSYNNGTTDQTLVEHWNGTGWKLQPSPDVGGTSTSNSFGGVTATSAANAWAVGDYYNGTVYQTLIERWNGSAWKVQPSPKPGGTGDNSFLSKVTATSPTNAWAVGYVQTPDGSARTLIERWNGSSWKIQPSPSPGVNGILSDVTAISSTNAWAVGHYATSGHPDQTLVEHWNGSAWKVQPSPNFGGPNKANKLFGVTATSSTNAWAVGLYMNGSAIRTLIERWNGSAWSLQPSPNLGSTDSDTALVAVTPTSPTSALAVGYYDGNGTTSRALALHCCS